MDFFKKKGQDVNLLFVVIILFVVAIIIVAGFRAVKEINTAVQNMPTATQEAKDITSKVSTSYVTWMDMLFLFIFALICIVLIGSAFFIDTHPIFFVVSILMMLVTSFLGGYIANAYASFAETPTLADDANDFVIIPYIFSHYIAIIVIIGTITSIALYAKIKGGG